MPSQKLFYVLQYLRETQLKGNASVIQILSLECKVSP